jgi:integrase/recombinase XerD
MRRGGAQPVLLRLPQRAQPGRHQHRQRNLHHLFKWLALRYEHPDPWTGDLVRYGPVKSRPSTLAEEFIRDLLAVSGGGRATSFVDIRDYAMIRMLTEGVRREELAQQEVTDLSEDLIARPFVRVVPLKGARDFSDGRLVPRMMTSAQALVAYLRVRRSHRQARLPALWLGSRNRGPMTGSGVYQMLDRRAEEAGYDPHAVHPHMCAGTDPELFFPSNGQRDGEAREICARDLGRTRPG